MNLQKELYFPTPIYFADLEDAAALNQTLLTRIYSWRDQDQAGVVRSNVKQTGSWHSDTSMNARPEFEAFLGLIQHHLSALNGDQQYSDQYHLSCLNMWANINPRHGYNRSHTHPGALWSGVYYVQTPPNCGQVVFQDPRAQANVMMESRQPNEAVTAEKWSEVIHKSIAGRLLLFPSWLRHEVEPNLCDHGSPAGDRISISFNCGQTNRPAS